MHKVVDRSNTTPGVKNKQQATVIIQRQFKSSISLTPNNSLDAPNDFHN